MNKNPILKEPATSMRLAAAAVVALNLKTPSVTIGLRRMETPTSSYLGLIRLAREPKFARERLMIAVAGWAAIQLGAGRCRSDRGLAKRFRKVWGPSSMDSVIYPALHGPGFLAEFDNDALFELSDVLHQRWPWITRIFNFLSDATQEKKARLVVLKLDASILVLDPSTLC